VRVYSCLPSNPNREVARVKTVTHPVQISKLGRL